MSNGVNLGDFRQRRVLGFGEEVDHLLQADSMVRHGFRARHLALSGDLLELADRLADALHESLGQDLRSRHAKQLVLDGGAAGVEYQYLHDLLLTPLGPEWR